MDFLARTANAPTVCVDCEWEPAMPERRLANLVRTLPMCYGSNKVADRPFRLVFSGVRAGSKTDARLRQVCGFENWAPRVRIEEEPYIKLFDRSRLTYLSPDGEGLADTFEDPDAVYVVGGLNDGRNSLKGKSRLKADLQGIASARLPLQEEVGVEGADAVLVPNQVLDILLARRSGEAWKEALASYVPARRQRRGAP
mmetsp:Transcript_89903/g.279307  ORF Transcript_89903/g.279307 Transcript_89903/m.279307 type:complete len:198 (-) Transcript_89903:18-611(-)